MGVGAVERREREHVVPEAQLEWSQGGLGIQVELSELAQDHAEAPEVADQEIEADVHA
jgi:hypothetical protein